jgi:hypothetical protein
MSFPRTALLSCIHANLPALNAVIADAERQGAERFVCLGDTAVGGPHPIETLTWVFDHCDWCLTGFWDWIMLGRLPPRSTSHIHMEDSAIWAHAQLQTHGRGPELLACLDQRPKTVREDHRYFIIGTPAPQNDYVINKWGPDCSQYFEERAESFYRGFPNGVTLCISGTSVFSGVVRKNGQVQHASLLPAEIELNEPLLFGLGPLGRPHDEDPQANYAILIETHLSFRRVSYDVDQFVAAVKKASLPEMLARRRVIAK